MSDNVEVKFTLITVFYKNKLGLRLTLNSIIKNLSILENKYKRLFNLLLVDSHSNDGSEELIAHYQKKYNLNLRYINVPQRGVYFAQDQAIKNLNIKNNRVLFINSGDVIFSFDPLIKTLKITNHKNFPEVLSSTVGLFYPPLFKVIFFDSEIKKPAHQGFLYNPNLHEKYGYYEGQLKYHGKNIYGALDYIFMKKVINKERDLLRSNELIALTELTIFNDSRDFKKQIKLSPLRAIIYFIEFSFRFPIISFIMNLLLVILNKKRFKIIKN